MEMLIISYGCLDMERRGNEGRGDWRSQGMARG